MSAYSVNSDPHLSASFKAAIAEHRAHGVDLSDVDQFLANTAHLMEPARPSPLVPPLVQFLLLVAAVAAVCGVVLAFLGL